MKVDMSPEAIDARLVRTGQLRALCLSLAAAGGEGGDIARRRREAGLPDGFQKESAPKSDHR